jgi:hypothetical protein
MGNENWNGEEVEMSDEGFYGPVSKGSTDPEDWREFVDYLGIRVGQATGKRAEAALRGAGFGVARGALDESSTMWDIVLWDAETEEPVTSEVAEKARNFLWKEGWGYVTILSIRVEL